MFYGKFNYGIPSFFSMFTVNVFYYTSSLFTMFVVISSYCTVGPHDAERRSSDRCCFWEYTDSWECTEKTIFAFPFILKGIRSWFDSFPNHEKKTTIKNPTPYLYWIPCWIFTKNPRIPNIAKPILCQPRIPTWTQDC